MAYYLSMDGVDDWIQAPNFAYTEVIMDMSADPTGKNYAKYIGGGGMFQRAETNQDNWFFDTVYKNGVVQSKDTLVVKANERATFRCVSNSGIPIDAVIIFCGNLGISGFMKGNIYSVKYYSGTNVVAHYDMTLGNQVAGKVQDQSGNGYHATLTGGTWVNDGGGSTGTPGSVSYATKQSLYQNASAAYGTKQVLTLTSSLLAATKQSIYQSGSTGYATQQNITDGGIPGSVRYATKQVIRLTSSVPFATKQAIWRAGSSQWATMQSIMDFVQIIRKIRLKGERRMKIKLLGSRQTVVRLKGELPMAKKNQNFEIDIGDSGDIEISASDSGTPINLSGATIQWEMRNGAKGPLLLSKSTASGVTVTNSAGGVFEIRLSSADTAAIRAGRYYHEAKIIDATGFVSTVTKGEATFVN